MFKKISLGGIFIIFSAVILLTPIQLSYADYDSFTVNIPNAQGGYTAIVIKQSGQGYVGPQGEYYNQFPSVSQLQAMYGGTAQPQDQDMDPRVSYFYDSLSPYGQWIKNDTYGMVWAPNNLPGDWRPYSDDGHWELTDYGWTWVSDLPWGWAAFHYGRWFYDNNNGWLWYPDRVWAPAWVAWRSGGDWVGWAPLPPEAIWHEGVGLEFDDHNFDPSHYNFCHFQDFTDPDIRRHIAGPAQNLIIINATDPTVTNIRIENNRVVNQLPFEHKIMETASHPIARFTISNLSTPGTHKVAGNQLEMFHPVITAHSKPPVVAPVQRQSTAVFKPAPIQLNNPQRQPMPVEVSKEPLPESPKIEPKVTQEKKKPEQEQQFNAAK